MEAKVLRAFTHKNTGIVWHDGETFRGTPEAVGELVSKGFLAAPKREAPASSVSVEQGERSDGEGVDLASMTVKQLVAICARRQIETPNKPRKADLIAAIQAADAAGE